MVLAVPTAFVLIVPLLAPSVTASILPTVLLAQRPISSMSVLDLAMLVM